jgi:hypothetical protein
MAKNEFHIDESVDVILLTYDEFWCQETYKDRFGDLLIKTAKKLNTTKWAVIDDISNWPVKTPADIDSCCDLTATLAQIGFQHCAVVGHKYAISKWMMEKVLPEEVEVAFFDSIDEGKKWLNSLGYNCNFD